MTFNKSFRARRANPEEILHRQIAGYLTLALPSEAWFSTFPAGGGGAIRGQRLKAAGLKAGVPDLLIVHQGRALFLELKAPEGTLSESQKTTIPAIERAGGKVSVCRTLEDVELALKQFGIEPRVKIQNGKIFDQNGLRLHTGKTAFVNFTPV